MTPMKTLTINGETFTVCDEDAQNRLEKLEGELAHIATITNDAEDVRQIALTTDMHDNPFDLKEVVILADFPAGATGAQLYIGDKMHSWICYHSAALSTAERRNWRFHLRHLYDGWWCAQAEAAPGDDPYVWKMYPTYGNVKSKAQIGKTLQSLCFYSNGAFPVGTVLEVYGR